MARDHGRPSTLGTLKAYFNQGLKDLQNFFVQPLPDSRQSEPTVGTAGQPTQAEIYHSRFQDVDAPALKAEGSVSGTSLERAERDMAARNGLDKGADYGIGG